MATLKSEVVENVIQRRKLYSGWKMATLANGRRRKAGQGNMTYDHNAALARHIAGMLSGEVYAIPKIIPQMFGGQCNFGGFDTPIPKYGLKTSDGWMYQFHTIADLHGWFRAHRRKK